MDGVVRVSAGQYYGTGVLLYDGLTILTAAHVLEEVDDLIVHFDTASGHYSVPAVSYAIMSGYQSEYLSHDIAIIRLSLHAPQDAERYDLYRQDDELGQVFTMVGYGIPGTGTSGVDEKYTGDYLRLKAENSFDTTAEHIERVLSPYMDWGIVPGTQLVADFDNGSPAADAFGVDSYLNSRFGEQAGWTRVSAYQEAIDTTIRAGYQDAPMSAEYVSNQVQEGDQGLGYVYFLLEFTGERAFEEQHITLEYATRDGSAEAGEDYLPVQGAVVLYPGETQVVLPVEIIGDTLPENDEYFFLDVFNPSYGDFGRLDKLTAMRTIVDDDFWLA
jgi:hypothetical protein